MIMNNFIAGDEVRRVQEHGLLTPGHTYPVVEVEGSFLIVAFENMTVRALHNGFEKADPKPQGEIPYWLCCGSRDKNNHMNINVCKGYTPDAMRFATHSEHQTIAISKNVKANVPVQSLNEIDALVQLHNDPVIRAIRSLEPIVNQDAIRLLKKVLADCESGVVVAVTIMSEYKDNSYMVHSSSAMSRLQTAGILLEAAISSLNQEASQ